MRKMPISRRLKTNLMIFQFDPHKFRKSASIKKKTTSVKQTKSLNMRTFSTSKKKLPIMNG